MGGNNKKINLSEIALLEAGDSTHLLSVDSFLHTKRIESSVDVPEFKMAMQNSLIRLLSSCDNVNYTALDSTKLKQWRDDRSLDNAGDKVNKPK